MSARVSDRLTTNFAHALAGPVGVAVSGGSDSIALLVLMNDWAKTSGAKLFVVTVDHGLRDESADEATHVAKFAQTLDVEHETLKWTGWNKRGNLQEAARNARMQLINDWAAAKHIQTVAMGHTRDDQAETVLLRLARGSGVDGLSGMQGVSRRGNLTVLRPLLDETRASLRSELTARGIRWIDDPSNDDPRFDRVKARQALATLAPLGIDADGLAATAERLQAARGALEHTAAAFAQASVDVSQSGDVVIDASAFWALAGELRTRVLAQAVQFVSSADYRPRFSTLKAAAKAACDGKSATVSGCLIFAPSSGEIRVAREFKAISAEKSVPNAPWDNRFTLTGPKADERHVVRALGADGLAGCSDWRDTGHPRQSLLASPAIWLGETLTAAPIAGLSNGWRATLTRNRHDFIASLLTIDRDHALNQTFRSLC